MNTPINYTVIDGVNVSQLIVRVNKAIQDGWTPIGGICVNDNRFYQSMIQQPFRIETTNSLD